jgi:hypothetical protein
MRPSMHIKLTCPDLAPDVSLFGKGEQAIVNRMYYNLLRFIYPQT